MPASTFSYAQAAKGLSSTAATSRASNASTLQPPVITKESINGQNHDVNSQSTQKPVEQAQPSQNALAEAHHAQPETSHQPSENSAQQGSSGSISPPSIDLIQSSISTLPREDDSSSVPVASSESTWENVSQASVSVDKVKDTDVKSVDKEHNDSKSAKESKDNSWTQVNKPQLEAPIPAVNIWKQRMEHASKSVPVLPKKLPTTNGLQHVVPSSSRVNHANGNSEKKSDLAKPYRGKDTKREPRLDNDQSRFKRDATRPHDHAQKIQPPSLQDEASWPTPELAQDEERKKPVDKEDKPEPVKVPIKKAEWKKVEVTHNVIWQTPMPNPHPRRGGRVGGRGGRELQSNRPSVPNSRTAKSPTQQPTSDSNVDEPVEIAATNDGDSPTHSKKPFANDGGPKRSPPANKEHLDRDGARHDSQVAQKEKASIEGNTNQQRAAAPQHSSSKKSGLGIDVDGISGESVHDRGSNGSVKSTSLNKKTSHDTHEEFRPATEDPAMNRHASRPNHASNGGRRGSIRGRGSYQSYHGHHSPSPGWSASPNLQFAKSPSAMQDPYWGANQHARGMRTPRGQSAASFSNGYGSSGVISPINAYSTRSPFEQPMQPMGTMPYQAMMDQYSLIGMVSMQLEYYFSLENLLRDMYLRKHMDSQGFVVLDVIAGFNRLKNLTQDLEILKIVCQQSGNIEYRLGIDGKSRIRKLEGWDQWVLEKSQREQSAQHDGVEAINMMSGSNPFMPDQAFYNAPRHSSLPQPLNSPQFTQYGNGQPYAQQYFNPMSVEATQQFQPSPPLFNQPFLHQRPVNHHRAVSGTNGYTPPVGDVISPPQPDVISDSQVENLVIMTRGPADVHNDKSDTSSGPLLEPSSTAITPYDGLGSTGLTEGDQCRKVSVADQEPWAIVRPLSRSDTSNSTFVSQDSALEKGVHSFRRTEPSVQVPLRNIRPERYINIRNNALKQRQLRTESGGYPHDMVVLYQFWRHYLVENFNTRMFEEFQTLAERDVQDYDNVVGMQNLLAYYKDAVLQQRQTSPAVIANLVRFAEQDFDAPSEDQLALQTVTFLVQTDSGARSSDISEILDLASPQLRKMLMRSAKQQT